MKPKEVATPNFLLKQAASFILSGTTDMASHPALSGVVNLPRVASRLRSQHSVRSRSPNHWRMRRFSLFYENVLGSAILLLAVTMLTAFFADPASAQERPKNNEFAVWFADQFASAHAFSEETNGHISLVETRYTRMILARRLIAVRYVADVVPWAMVGDPHGPDGSLVYAHGVGGSPVGLQLNFLHDRHVQPFITSGGGFLYFNRRMFGTKQQFNFTAQFGGGVQLLNPSRRASLYLGYMYHHISNANMDRTNPGLGSHMLFVGVSFLR